MKRSSHQIVYFSPKDEFFNIFMCVHVSIKKNNKIFLYKVKHQVKFVLSKPNVSTFFFFVEKDVSTYLFIESNSFLTII